MKPFATLLLFIMLSGITIKLQSQVNAYAKVSSISSTTLNVSTSNETYAAFSTGMTVIVMQMQDNVIGTNTANNSSFGALSSIQSTGLYELAIVSSVVRSSGVITQIIINSPLANTYNTGANSSVQLISFPELGTPNYSTVSDITAVPWNGSVGGVVAFRVSGTLTLNHNITADYAGFRGGASNGGTAGSCDGTTYISNATDHYANKGEGIYKASNTSYAAGRGRVINGGGGGNSHNGGGGGGANISSGGEGGKGFGCSSNAGGLGGVNLYSFTSTTRVFMGGGGGAGEANNNYTTSGGNGGGIVVISANQVTTIGSGSVRISANGQSASNVGNDGAGGGGAGGSLMLKVANWNVASTRPLTITANGGNGGSVTDASSHGGGGGGGQGSLIFSTGTPVVNITTNTLNGNGGRNSSGGTYAENGVGASNVGIFTGSFALLPVKIVSFKATRSEKSSILEWKAVNEVGSTKYVVQKSEDRNIFVTIAEIKAAGINGAASYMYEDRKKPGSNIYYRIVIQDEEADMLYSNIVQLKERINDQLTMSLAPNPVKNQTSIMIESSEVTTGSYRIVNSTGLTLSSKSFLIGKGESRIQVDGASRLPNGSYYLLLNARSNMHSLKMLVSR
jgi:hypothetical protein